jgi:hypothetical protein
MVLRKKFFLLCFINLPALSHDRSSFSNTNSGIYGNIPNLSGF